MISEEELKKQTLGKGVQFALDTVSKLIGNPIVLVDLTYRLLAYTETTMDDDPLYNELTSLGKFTHETVDFFNSEKFIAAFSSTSTIALMPSKKLKYNRATAIIYDREGLQLGSYTVIECFKKLEQSDYEIMIIAAEILSEELLASANGGELSRVFQESLISCLIEGKSISTEQEQSILDELYGGLKKNIYVAVIDIIQYENTLTHLVYFRDLFSKLKNDFKYYIYLNNIVAIIHTDAPVIGVKKELKELNDFFSRYKIYAGISDSFQNLSEIRTYFKQALNALNFGIESNDDRNIFMYADFKLECFIRDNCDKVNELCHPTVAYMYSYDEENNTRYRDILCKYLSVGRDLEKTAKLVGIGQVELVKKLAEIEDIFEIELTNINTIFAIYCCMKLHGFFPEKFET